LAVQERVKEADDVAMRALMKTLILSVNWFRVRKVHQRVTEPHVKFKKDRNSPLFGIPYRSSEFEVEMLDEQSFTRTQCCKLCVAPNSLTDEKLVSYTVVS